MTYSEIISALQSMTTDDTGFVCASTRQLSEALKVSAISLRPRLNYLVKTGRIKARKENGEITGFQVVTTIPQRDRRLRLLDSPVIVHRKTGASNNPIRADRLADLLASEVFDTDDAANFLNIKRQSVEIAARYHRIPYVQYGTKRLFTRSDLEDYRSKRGVGRSSNLIEKPVYVVDSKPV